MKPFLYPLSFLYGVVVFFRNRFYDLKIFKSKEYHLPVISVGNITVGGTGKTPHAEYLIRLLKDQFKIAFLSRGYKRKTRDFIVATDQSTAESIGDEPTQIKHKFPELIVAVDKKRANGIDKLIENVKDLDIVLLDDAFQHRAVSPGISILLIDYNRPIYNDSLLPYGRLREPRSQKKRADIVIVTKVPRNITPMEKRLFQHNINTQAHQNLYFSTIKYGEALPVFKASKKDESSVTVPDFSNKNMSILLVTGIADPQVLIKELKDKYKEVITVSYPDHYSFTQNDISNIEKQFIAIQNSNKIILTTEKDAARLTSAKIDVHLHRNWYYLPIEIEFLGTDGEHFNRQILHYVNNNSRNSILYKK